MAHAAGALSSSADDSDCDSVRSVIFKRTRQQQQNKDTRSRTTMSPSSYSVAASVYVLIEQGRSMSADMRVMWYLKRLGVVQAVDDRELNVESPEKCKVVSFVPRQDRAAKECASDASVFVMDAFTRVYFLTHVNNMVYCLDMSPSNCSVDIQRGHVMLDEMMVALKRSIEGFVMPFIVPGSKDFIFEPQVYITVIVHTPFYTSLAQQVLVQGWLINNNNVEEFIDTVFCEMNLLENALANTKIINRKSQTFENFDDASGNNDPGATSEDQDPNLGYKPDNNITSTNNIDSSKSLHINLSNSDENLSSIGNNNPDSGFINTLRYGMLAVRLLPQTSISNLIVITDGMITLADIQVLDSVLNQLRCIGVACSFLHVSSQFHPNSGHGHVPYSELMQLIATATSGTYLNSFPEAIGNLEVNYYHDKFILWSFKQGDGINSPNNTTNLSCTPTRVRPGEWTVRNSNFYGNRQTQLVSKRQISDHVQAHLENIVCCRMREGFIIEDIQFKDAGNRDIVLSSNNSSKLQLKFILPWTNHIYIEYDLILRWPPPVVTKTEPLAVEFQELLDSQFLSIPDVEPSQEPVPMQLDGCSNVHYTVVVKGPYEFLHDITCNRSKKSQLPSRMTRKCQFQLSSCQSSSCRSSSVPVTAATTTITKHINLMLENTTDTPPSPRIVSSKYRQALIARFWSTMRSIVQTDMLIKHLETYSPSTGHLIDYSVCMPRKRNENHDRKQLLKLDITVTPEMLETAFSDPAGANIVLNGHVHQVDATFIAGMTEANSIHFFMSGVPNRSPLCSGMPLFYYLPTNSNTSFSLKQSQVKLNDQQQSYTDQQHQQFADFWKPVCTLDPDSQWPKWFSTYRIGGGVLILRHDRPLPQWLHMANVENGRYHTLTCRKAAESLFALLKQWCTFVLIDEHTYVKCLDRSETHIGNVSFCIARVSQRPPTCCCLVLHLAFQSCVPAFVHQKIINELQNSIVLLDSTTAVKPPLSPIENILLAVIDKKKKIKKIKENEKEKKKKTEKIESVESEKLPTKKKVTMPPQRYVYLLDKPLEKILIRYERIPTQFTTVIFPDGSQSYPAPAMTTSNVPNHLNSKQRGGKQNDVVVDESLTGVESKNVTTTTTLSRYLYHKRWIWGSGRSRYSKCSSSASLKLELQLAHTLSVLTKIRMREGFKFAHSSSGIINMVLQVDMVEGSSTCPITPTSHCVIQYVLFPPNILHKHQSRDSDYASIVDQLKKKNNEDERSSSSSIDDQQQIEKRYRQEENVFGSDLYSCTRRYGEDDYQLITECWIEPQHGFVVVSENQNNEYMSGLTYEQLAEAILQVDSDCISSFFTYQYMDEMCMDPNISLSNSDNYFDENEHPNKTIIIDAGRIYKLPFTFSLYNLLPKCRYHSSITYDLFTEPDDTDNTDYSRDDKKLNNMFERSFYTRLRTVNDRSFDVDDSNLLSGDTKQPVLKQNGQEIGQCFVKRVDATRLIVTVAPSCEEEGFDSLDNASEDNSIQPISRSRASTWHHNKRTVDHLSSSLCLLDQDDSTHFYRTMSVGSRPRLNTDVVSSLTRLKHDHGSCTPVDAGASQSKLVADVKVNQQSLPKTMCMEFYDCRQGDVENVLLSDNHSFDHRVIDDYTDNSSCSSNGNSLNNSDRDESEDGVEDGDSNQPENQLYLREYLDGVEVVYNRSLVTTVFHALHLGLNVQHMDVQRAVNRCQNRVISFDITDYLKVICDHLKTDCNKNNICPADNKSLKSHHDMIHSSFSSTLERHMLVAAPNHPDYYFYDFIEKLEYNNGSQKSSYMSRQVFTNCSKKKYLAGILGEIFNKTHFDTYEIDEQDLFPLFVHLVCTVKSSNFSTKRSVRSLPTCIIELMNKCTQEEIDDVDFADLKITLDVYCLMLPNPNDVDGDHGYGLDDSYSRTNSSEQLLFPKSNKSKDRQSKRNLDEDDNPFVYLNSSLPLRHSQGLSAFIAEVEWCMRDEMAAGLLNDPNVTPDTLEKIIEHVTSSPYSSSNEHQKIPVHFVVPPPGHCKSKYNSCSLFLQKLDQLDIMVDYDTSVNGDRMYILKKSTSDTFYVAKKNFSPDCTVSENTNFDEMEINCDSPEDWMTDTAERPESGLPNFWMILKIQANQPCQKDHSSDGNNAVNTLYVNMYFHCRYTELDVQGKYSAVREAVGQCVRQAATTVNQTLLLYRLHDTRTCDPLLEPIVEDLINSDDDENGNSNTVAGKFSNHFALGQFKCPVVWSTRFALHPRLQHSTSMLLLGVQVLHTVLDKFSVRNRRNMFVYKESSGSVFYLRLYENSSQQQHNPKNNMGNTLQYDSDDEDSISRCSSATSTTATISSSTLPYSNSNFPRKYSEDLNYLDSRSTQTPGTRSLGGYWGDTDSKDVEDLTLKVHGISHVGTEIRNDLVEVLQNRLNDAVLEVLTAMLYRNPVCRLYPDDVRFIQPFNGHPDYTTKLSLPLETKINKFFIRNLQRNAAALLFYPPKYASRHHKFNYVYDDTFDGSEKPVTRLFFIYNQPGGTSGTGGMRGISGNRGIACVLYDIYSSNGDNDSTDSLYDYPTDPELFQRRIQATCIDDDDSKPMDEYSGYIKIYVWRRGRIHLEALQLKLNSIVTNCLWDIYIEQFLCEQPIVIEEPLETYVNPLCIQYLAKWIAFGARLSVPLARYSHSNCRIHMNHVLREFKKNLTWLETSTSKNSSKSVRYFYIPRTEYGESSVGNNVIGLSEDPLQLEQDKNDSLINTLKFYEWKLSDTADSIVSPPSAANVLIIVSVTSTKKTKQKRKRYQRRNKANEISDSDTDNGLVVPEDEEYTNSEEGNTRTSVVGDPSTVLDDSSNDNVPQPNATIEEKTCRKQPAANASAAKRVITKLLMLNVSNESVHTLSYNFDGDDHQHNAVERLCRWLEWRRTFINSSVYQMMGLKNPYLSAQLSGTPISSSHFPRAVNNLDVLLDYKSYVAAVGEHGSYDKFNSEKNSRPPGGGRNKSIDDADDKKNKSVQYEKDVHDLFLEKLVKNAKQQRRIEMQQKLLYDMWVQGDAIITKEALRVFYQQSRLLHYCLTPLLFLPRWRLESAATRDHMKDTNNSPFLSPPQWHKRLCARLTAAYTNHVQKNPLFTGFQLVQVGGKTRAFNDGATLETTEHARPSTSHFKLSVPGPSGGILFIETGVCQPFYYVKLCCVERDRLANQFDYYEDKHKAQYSLIDQSEYITRKMHLHSFVYDFHVRVLSDRLSKLVQKQKTGKRSDYSRDLATLLEQRNSVQSNANNPESSSSSSSSSQKNAIVGFLDDFLKYYTTPPLHSGCLVLAGVVEPTQIPVTGLQLYEYLLENCAGDCDGMAVLKICDTALADSDVGVSLFDDDDDEDGEEAESRSSECGDPTDFILVHRVAGSDIRRGQESKTNPTKPAVADAAANRPPYDDCQLEQCGLYDATLVVTVRQLLLDAGNGITVSYHVLLTNNENDNFQKKEPYKAAGCDDGAQQRRGGTPVRPCARAFEQSNGVLISASSVPSNSYGNTITSGLASATCWGSLDENTSNNWSRAPPNCPFEKSERTRRDRDRLDDGHRRRTVEKGNFIRFFERTAAELVAQTVDTAANRCRLHLLWQKFNLQQRQQHQPHDHHQKSPPGGCCASVADVTVAELEELVNRSGFVKPLSVYDKKIGHLVNELRRVPQWFVSLYRLIGGQTSCSSTTTTTTTTTPLPPPPQPPSSVSPVRCRMYHGSKQQYLVVLPNRSEPVEIDAFVIVDNGATAAACGAAAASGAPAPTNAVRAATDRSDGSPVNIVFRRNAFGSEEVNALVETVSKAMCYTIWRAVAAIPLPSAANRSFLY